MSLRRAILWSAFWVTCAFAFAGILASWRGIGAAQLFLAGYLIEKSLSVDNLMVFAAIFTYFGIATTAQPRLLYWGFFGAAIFRLVFLVAGTALMNLHPAVGCIFAAIVFALAVQMLRGGDDDAEPTDYEAKWFVKLARKLSTTPAFVCLVAIEISDIIFSFDSLPAVIAVTRDPVIVYAAVIFAILGLRSMYFVLVAMMAQLNRLAWGVCGVLFFISAKLMAGSLAEWTGYAPLHALELGPTPSLLIVVGFLTFGVIASIAQPPKNETAS